MSADTIQPPATERPNQQDSLFFVRSSVTELWAERDAMLAQHGQSDSFGLDMSPTEKDWDDFHNKVETTACGLLPHNGDVLRAVERDNLLPPSEKQGLQEQAFTLLSTLAEMVVGRGINGPQLTHGTRRALIIQYADLTGSFTTDNNSMQATFMAPAVVVDSIKQANSITGNELIATFTRETDVVYLGKVCTIASIVERPVSL